MDRFKFTRMLAFCLVALMAIPQIAAAQTLGVYGEDISGTAANSLPGAGGPIIPDACSGPSEWDAVGLPTGLSIGLYDGIISGQIAETGPSFTVTVTAEDSGVPCYKEDFTFSIDQATLIVTPDNKNVYYNDAAPTSYGYTVSGLELTDTEISLGLDLIPLYPTSTYTPGDPAGVPQTITVLCGAWSFLTNYDVDCNATGTLTVDPIVVAKPTLTGTTSFTYDGAPHFVSLSPPSLLYDFASGNTETNVGTHSATVALDDPLNYEWDDGSSTDLTLPWSITQAPLKIITDDYDIPYGSSCPTHTYEFDTTTDKFMPGDNEGNSLTGTPTVTCLGYTTIDPVGSVRSIEMCGWGSTNYAITCVSGTLTVVPKEISLAEVVLSPSEPETGDYPIVSLSETEFDVAINWSPASAGSWNQVTDPFDANEVYTATFTLTTKNGNYEFGAAPSVTLNGVSKTPTSIASSVVEFEHTFPVTSATPPPTVTGIAITSDPTKVNYKHGESLNLFGLEVTLELSNGSFQYNVPFTSLASAKLTGTSVVNGDLLDISDNGKTVTVTHGGISATSTTWAISIVEQEIATANVGITPPATTGTPNALGNVTGGGTQFDVTSISWDPPDATFAASTPYKATVELKAISGYKFDASTTATVNSGAIVGTANTGGGGSTLTFDHTFPETASTSPTPIATAAITVTAPVTNEQPDGVGDVVINTGTGEFDVTNVTWSPTVVGNAFAANTPYTVKVKLTAVGGYTFNGGLSTATISGQNATVSANNGTDVELSLTFLATLGGGGTGPSIAGVVIKTPPTKTSYEHDEHLDLSGLEVTLTYSDGTPPKDVGFANFETNGCFSIPSHGDVISIEDAPFIFIRCGSSNKSTPITVVNAKISTAAVDIEAPVTDEIPSTVATGPVPRNFNIVTVSWSPNDNPFKEALEYMATVTLTAKIGYEFADTFTAKINGETAVVVIGTDKKTATLSHQFPPTSLPTVVGIEVVEQPKLTYSDGDLLDLSDMRVNLIWSSGKKEYVNFADFADNYISTNPKDGTKLEPGHHGTTILVMYNDGDNPIQQTSTYPLFVASTITSVVLNIDKPISEEIPSTKAGVRSNDNGFSVYSVTWTPEHAAFQSRRQYTVIITLEVEEGFAFTSGTAVSLNGKEPDNVTVGHKGATLTLSYTFEPTTAIVVVKIGDQIIDPTKDNKLEFVTKCSDGSDLPSVSISSGAEGGIIHGGGDFNPDNLILDYGENLFNFTVPDEDGNPHGYTLSIIKPMEMIKMRWGNTLAVIDDPAFDKYEIVDTSYVWYRNGREIGKGWFWSTPNGEPINPRDVYHVEAKTEAKKNIRSCEYQLPAQTAQEYGILVKNNQMNTLGLEIVTPEKAETEVFIYNISGSLVHRLKGNLIKETNIPSGLYLVKARAKGESGAVYRYSTKLVIKK
ncbi:MAG: T9SS type A sorting domain-containing protein [Fibromonadaceae bacterium]|nr:T9SS type A sorting domain-containing protein [Fibromonadaceae bacterium]